MKTALSCGEQFSRITLIILNLIFLVSVYTFYGCLPYIFTYFCPGYVAQSDTGTKGPGFGTRSGHILSFSPSADSRKAVVSYLRQYVHEVQVNCLGGISLPMNSVVRLTDRPDMILAVYHGRKTTTA